MRNRVAITSAVALIAANPGAVAFAAIKPGTPARDAAPGFSHDGHLIPPNDDRESAYFGTGLDMSHAKQAISDPHPEFDYVFAAPV